MSLMMPEKIAGRPPSSSAPAPDAMQQARERMMRAGQWRPTQMLGRRWTIGCVALEVTQRCNLDCTLCYLSEMSEAVRDVPLVELFRRIDMIAQTYGPGTGVQITGGDPTLRNADDLVQIVRKAREHRLRPTLFTNGIRATRELLARLADAGLMDVAFHVDTTQRRRSFRTEADLDAVRLDYLHRVRRLGLAVFFNTTVHEGNFDEIPGVVRFFVHHSDQVRIASFQLQAETGRGVQGRRPEWLTTDAVAGQIEAGAGAPLAFGGSVGHRACNRYAVTLVADGRVHDISANPEAVAAILHATAGLAYDHAQPWTLLTRLARWGARNPVALARCTAWSARVIWEMRDGLAASRGRVRRLSFFIHDFMDACHLQPDRIEACAFMAATAEGPVSMCLHNARRDDFILKATRIPTAAGKAVWDPLTGALDGRGGLVRRFPRKGRGRMGRKPVVARSAAAGGAVNTEASDALRD